MLLPGGMADAAWVGAVPMTPLVVLTTAVVRALVAVVTFSGGVAAVAVTVPAVAVAVALPVAGMMATVAGLASAAGAGQVRLSPGPDEDRTKYRGKR